jgi:hypothetical protein
MQQLSRRTLAGLVLTTSAASGFCAQAQNTGPTRLRGTIVTLEGNLLTVATRDGPSVVVTLAEPLMVSALRRVALTDITAGTSIGAVAEPGTDGTLRAVAITVLPLGARITERQIPWDLPNTSMNDGPVEAVVESSAGRELTLSINGKSVKVQVGADTPLLMPIPAARADLVAGAAVFINATRNADGTFSAARVTVGKDGVAPAI